MSAFDPNTIDEVIHGRLRLGVMAYLSTAGTAPFTTLKHKLAATDGNLSVQLAKLEEAGYVRIEKRFEGKKPLTEAHLTEKGRAAWLAYLDQMRALLGSADLAAE
jgi:DNA-binding MarR family transcriptional regulator